MLPVRRMPGKWNSLSISSLIGLSVCRNAPRKSLAFCLGAARAKTIDLPDSHERAGGRKSNRVEIEKIETRRHSSPFNPSRTHTCESTFPRLEFQRHSRARFTLNAVDSRRIIASLSLSLSLCLLIRNKYIAHASYYVQDVVCIEMFAKTRGSSVSSC